MQTKPTILNIAAIVHIIYSVVYYFRHGQRGDEEGWGMMATFILVVLGVSAILLDLLLQKVIRRRRTLASVEIPIVLLAWFFIYKY